MKNLGQNFQIIHADCIEAMRDMLDKTIHLTVCSPPYFGVKVYDGEGELGQEATVKEYVENLSSIFKEVYRITKDSGLMFLNIADSYTGYHGNKNHSTPKSATSGWVRGTNENIRQSTIGTDGYKEKDMHGVPYRVADRLRRDGWYLRSDLIWLRTMRVNPRVVDRPHLSHEHVFMFTKSKRGYFFDQSVIRSTILKVSNHIPKGVDHPAIMPEDLADLLIQAGSEPGQTVFDPFLGSGTTGAASVKLGRNFIGCERLERFIHMAIQRIKKSADQPQQKTLNVL